MTLIPGLSCRALLPLLLLLTAASFACRTGVAGLLAYDGFSYRSGLSLSGQSGGGSLGFVDAWTLGGVGTPVHQVGDAGLADPTGDLITSGLSATATAPSALGFTTARRTLATPMGAAGTRRYISFLLRPDGTLGEGDAGGYFGVELASDGTPAFAGKASIDRYVVEDIGGTGQSATAIEPVLSEPALLVLRADFAQGADTLRLYLNPSPGRPEPILPDAIKADSDVGLVSSIWVFSSGAFSFDEIRVGETFADVTPVPEPAGAWLACAVFAATSWRRRRQAERGARGGPVRGNAT